MTNPHPSEGHWTFWRDGISIKLAQELATQLGAELEFEIIQPGGGPVEITKRGDIAFVPFSWYPNIRPTKWIYTFCSDVKGYEDGMFRWMDYVRPNLIGCLQDMPDWLVAWGRANDCAVKLLPWFVCEEVAYNQDRPIDIMCSGAIGPTYPMRTKIYQYVQTYLRDRAVLSCGPFGQYPLNRKDYLKALNQIKYYITGGIYDKFIPPKYYEVCNYGCCLVSFPMPRMGECGFVHGNTCIQLASLKDIEKIIETDSYIEIGKDAQAMVQSFHSVRRRAEQIIEVYNAHHK